jgi:hypothetical protein
MMMILLWLQQPTSIAGVSALVGTVSAVLTHQLGWSQAVPLLAGALVSIAIPDNTAVKAAAETLAQDVVSILPQPSNNKPETK